MMESHLLSNGGMCSWKKIRIRVSDGEVIREKEDMFSDAFTFQTILHKNGDIVFIYKDVSYSCQRAVWPNVSRFPTTSPTFPTPVTLSNSGSPTPTCSSTTFIRPRLRNESFTSTTESSWTPRRLSRTLLWFWKPSQVSLFFLLVYPHCFFFPACISFDSCDSCTNATIPHFNCLWCHAKKSHGGPFCTDESGLHRRRQQWFEGNCYQRSKALYCDADDEDETYDEEDYAPVKPKNPSTGGRAEQTVVPLDKDDKPRDDSDAMVKKKEEAGGGVATLTLVVIVLVCFVAWLAYAYYNPHTTSGQMLIKVRSWISLGTVNTHISEITPLFSSTAHPAGTFPTATSATVPPSTCEHNLFWLFFLKKRVEHWWHLHQNTILFNSLDLHTTPQKQNKLLFSFNP